MSRKFTVEVEQSICINAEITTSDLINFIENYADRADLEKISESMAKKHDGFVCGVVNGSPIEHAPDIIQDVLRELMLVGESAAIELLRHEMRKQGIQVVVGGAA